MTLARTMECVAAVVGRPVTPGDTVAGLGVDSVDGLDLAFRLERAFDIKFAEAEAARLLAPGLTVSGLADYVAAKVRGDTGGTG